MNRFYPLRRRHRISRPKTGPVVWTFQFDEGDFQYTVPKGLNDLADFLKGGKTFSEKVVAVRVLDWCRKCMILYFADKWVVRSEPTGFSMIHTVTITAERRTSPKLKAYFNLS